MFFGILTFSNFDLSVCLEQTNQRPLCVMGDSPQCGEMPAEQTKGLARSVPTKSGGGLFFLVLPIPSSLRDTSLYTREAYFQFP